MRATPCRTAAAHHLDGRGGRRALRDRYPEVTPGNYILLAVTDTGAGMTPEVCRAPSSRSSRPRRSGRGSGLGLSMVYGFLKQSNGHVSIYSEVGLGTTVRLYLPARGPPADLTAAQAGAGASRRAGETILVTEDDPFVRRMSSARSRTWAIASSPRRSAGGLKHADRGERSTCCSRTSSCPAA